jgi:DNA-binding FadR family transcriptional regulator
LTAIRPSRNANTSLLRYAHAFTVQTSQTALVNGRAKLEARRARWLLMAHDSFDQNDFPFTRQFIAMMLGVRRAGVTEALHILEGRDLIKARRGEITVVNRKGLEALSDRSYGVPARLVLRNFDRTVQSAVEPTRQDAAKFLHNVS